MSAKLTNSVPFVGSDEPDHDLRDFFQAVRTVLASVADGVHFDLDFLALKQSLETLPLDELDADLAARRIVNAQWYSAYGEMRAARYEMSQLARRVARALNRAR